MSDWYYAQGGQRFGPVSRMRIEELARQGELQPADLLWTESMEAWQAAAEVPGIFSTAPKPDEPAPLLTAATATSVAPSPATHAQLPSVAPVSDRFLNPYATPQSERARVAAPVAAALAGEEIEPGSVPIGIGSILQRSWQLTFRHYGIIFLVGVVYIGLLIALTFALKAMDSAFGLSMVIPNPEGGPGTPTDSPLSIVISNIVSMWLSLGLIRIGLNIVSGSPVSVGLLFGEGGKLLKAIGGYILYAVVVALGFVALIIPGIYLAIKYGQFITAIVDRDLSILESFRYSASLTKNNKWLLVAMGFVAVFVILGGVLALFVGVFIAYPMVWLMSLLAYRWMQYGQAAVQEPQDAARHAIA